MIDGTDLSGKLAFDANSLNQLKQSSKENSPEALKAVAKQFEAVLMNMMLKSMRDATPQEGMFDNEQSKMFTSMLDQQLSSHMSAKGLGLADMLVKQLSKTVQTTANAGEKIIQHQSERANETLHQWVKPIAKHLSDDLSSSPLNTSAKNTVEKSQKNSSITGTISEFMNKMLDHAKAASASTGIPSHLMLGQAALESAWGKREVKGLDGTASHNLFGIKATGSWKGKVVEAHTTEYINGIKQKRIEKFRAYDSYADSFKDFANLIKNNPRYQQVVDSIGDIKAYTNAMQKAGYATDPDYAKKLMSVIQKMMS